MSEKLLPFMPLKFTDRSWISDRLTKSDFRGCEYSFGNNYIWRNQYGLEVLNYKGFYITKTCYKGIIEYGFPAGDGNLKDVIQALIMDAQCRKETFRMKGVTEDSLEKLNSCLPGCFEYEAVRGESDYIYLTNNLTTLSGKKMSSKRNHIARFKDNPNWTYEVISLENLEECFEFNENWCKENECFTNETLKMEYCAVKQAFENYFALNFAGSLLRRNGEIIAFSMGEPLNSDTFVVHIEKAYHHIQGAYPMINQQFVIKNCQDYKYINREDDADDEGLRKSKLSYNPEILLTKYKLKLKESGVYDFKN